MLHHISAVGFDLDNTLYAMTDNIQKKITDYILERASTHLQKPIVLVQRIYQQLYQTTRSARRSLANMGVPEPALIVQEALERADIASVLHQDQRLATLLERLRTHYHLFLITGSTEQQTNNKLQALGVRSDLFSYSQYAGSRYERHDGSVFRHVATTFEIPHQSIFFVGDREPVDILPAKSLGITTAIVNAVSEAADFQLQTIYDLETILLP